MTAPIRLIIVALCILSSPASVAGIRRSIDHTAIPSTDVVHFVSASVETASVPGGADGADDPAIWIHPSDTSLNAANHMFAPGWLDDGR